jgi:hypothetical protein
MDDEPVAVDPGLAAAGRSVEGVLDCCAKAGAAASAVAKRPAAICFLSMDFS